MMSRIDDLCGNSDCALSDEGHLSSFVTYADWQHAHKGCWYDEHRDDARTSFSLYNSFTWDDDKEKWIRKT